ncbi:ATP-dependent nuclease [Chromohalobacter canadensis]|uniref:AAA family ATPase n=1 Tax=Chromohalobacter canadensis TaxID=141389 RepID=A0ABZ0Y7K8_9GAMM|nr:AAA family ATPase [Chromohalobacter canadensis]MCK0770320.1 AAA family ATPase [Chromohalobacter canadensis]WQH08040.1 AAA family ATPase [Chromohalobacter canadensis]
MLINKIKIYGYRVYNQFILEPNQKINLIVGANEAGKSTLMEAITLALTGRVNGRYASEELNPYWFNTIMVNDFLCKLQGGMNPPLPEIRIELFFGDRAELQQLCGAINTDVPTTACPGISMRAYPNTDYASEIDEWKKNPSHLLPVEYYVLDWRSFADEKITRRPRQLSTAVIDSRTVRSLSGVDYHLRQILGDHLDPAERAEISLAFRQMKASMSETSLSGVNDRIGGLHAALHDRPMALAMDQSARTSWESSVIPHVDNVPFSMSGQGQQAAIKISLAMSRHSGATNFVMVEEPENHLTHTSLTTLISRIRSLASNEQQLFVTTHSSFVLNRLGLDALLLVENSLQSRIPDLDPETVSYFQKLPGYDTLRMILAKKVVLVEGPSDEIIFERIFNDLHGKQPMECGIDVLSMRGLSLRRCLELCASVDKKVAALRDNDGASPEELSQAVQSWLKEGKREIFIGKVEHGETLEPQLIHHNGESSLRKILGIRADADLATWMKREKTEGAIRIASTSEDVQPPEYMVDAARFIYG